MYMYDVCEPIKSLDGTLVLKLPFSLAVDFSLNLYSSSTTTHSETFSSLSKSRTSYFNAHLALSI